MIPPGLPHLQQLAALQLAVFPEHAEFLGKRFSGMSEAEFHFAELIAGKIVRIAGRELQRVCVDYRWLNGVILDEELHFRRTGRYRLSTFEEADAQVYADSATMSRYMNGVLASQLWWRNHSEMLRYFAEDFLARNPSGFHHLEVGPGHGLLLSLAAASPGCRSAEGWDISDSSLLKTRAALAAMQSDRNVSLKKQDIFAACDQQFTSIAFSEVLEHLERPADALAILRGLLADDGRLFLNAPVNSPAPDHLYLFETPEQILTMATDAGFSVESSKWAPITGVTLERARKRKLTISVGVILRKA